MPPWLVERSRRLTDERERHAVPPDTWIAMLRDGIPGPRNGESGQRNTSLARLTAHLLRHYVHIDVVAELVHLVYATRCDPPLPARTVDRIVDSIARSELARRERRGRR
jgi:hypothetical protein